MARAPPRPQFTQHHASSATSLLSSSSGPRSEGRHSSGYASSLAEKYSLSPSPASWGMQLNMPEPDDELHNPAPNRDRLNDKGGSVFTARGLANLGCLFILAAGIMTLFAGFPILTHFLSKTQTTQGGFNLGGVNATGQIADLPGNWGLIDRDTPKDVYTKKSYMNPNDEWVLVFSDEFNQDGRSFYPGDDPYWEAVDLHYWGTNDLEWYDPSGATTGNGSLLLTLEKVSNPDNNHNLSYKSGMIQSWNKFCFTGGLIETSVMLPGDNTVHGLWPAIWTMGNLGRAGFGASLEGMWPFSYDSCDVGTLPNQTYPGTQTPLLAVTKGDPFNHDALSYLPGQRLSACTCPGESHPGPVRSDGTYVGRAAPEIDIFEATVTDGMGQVSQSAQWAPFNAEYQWFNTSDNMIIVNTSITQQNSYAGGAFQQTTSGLSVTNQGCYERNQACYAVYGFEYKAGFDKAYITWINDGKVAWTVMQGGLAADKRVEIGPRPIPQEPMYIIANLGFSINFGGIDFENIVLPATMRVDWIRVYQPKDAVNIGCDPKDYPTSAYIETYKEAYTNSNLTLWRDDFHQSWPKNRLMPGGC
ncbi:putative beta-glucan synthesis-associated protein [Lyophyllum shimeji]|uniref:Beta-glucan synthesis-associated protein n=1 Tax=Lyophyllum shimeji TaxID=47721 RepID=A0A9P3PWZ8_LYOSH|nr:putative beta-glucan synthesis-associated protein [Lyophyllum shimeji]